METHANLSATNGPVGFVDDAPNLALLGPRMVKLLQNNSPEVMRGDPAYVPGAEGGDFLVPNDDEERTLRKGATGFDTILVAFEECFCEWPPSRGVGSGGPLERHAKKPVDADWQIDQATGRNACLRTNGNRVERIGEADPAGEFIVHPRGPRGGQGRIRRGAAAGLSAGALGCGSARPPTFHNEGWADQAALLGWTMEGLYRVPPAWARVSLTGAALLISDRRVIRRDGGQHRHRDAVQRAT